MNMTSSTRTGHFAICQIHGQTKKKLRGALEDDAALFHLVA